MKLARPIKNRILQDLRDLVAASVLGEVQVLDVEKELTDNNYSRFPAAVLGIVDQVPSDYADTQNNIRTYSYPIYILAKPDDFRDDNTVEDLVDNVLNKFDTDYTLGGAAQAAVVPDMVTGTITVADKTYVVIVVIIKARVLYQLGS